MGQSGDLNSALTQSRVHAQLPSPGWRQSPRPRVQDRYETLARVGESNGHAQRAVEMLTRWRAVTSPGGVTCLGSSVRLRTLCLFFF